MEMYVKKEFLWIVIAVFMLSQTAFAEGINLETVYPYSLEHKIFIKLLEVQLIHSI